MLYIKYSMNVPTWHVVTLDFPSLFSGPNSRPQLPFLTFGKTCLAIVCLITAAAAAENPGAKATPAKVSYYRDVRPILQANCQGCHQPAKAKGGYVMTEFKRLLAGGDSEGEAIVPEHPEKSAVLKMITPQDGEVKMPKGKTPLMENDVALIRAWIEQG